VAFWLLNPLTINMSTRGSFEVMPPTKLLVSQLTPTLTSKLAVPQALTCTLILAVIYTCIQQRYDASAVLFGLVVHLRIYPIVFALPLVLCISYQDANAKGVAHRFIDIFSFKCIRYAFVSGVLFLAIGFLYYQRYGYEFLHETFFYHLIR